MGNFRIMKTHEYNDAIFYRASCGCGSHNVNMEMELDKETDSIILTFFLEDLEANVWYHYKWGILNYLKRVYLRIKWSAKVLLTGRLKVTSEFVFNDPKQIKDYCSNLLEGLKKLEKENK